MRIKAISKRLTALLLCVALICVCFSACGTGGAVNISEASVSSGVYSFYLDRVLSYPKQFGLSEGFTKQDAIDKAAELCKKHIAISSICEQRGFSLSNLAKSDAASQVENRWSLFNEYYTSIGVTKQDYSCIAENEAKRALLIESLYGADGESPVSDATLKKAFNANYVGFKAITGYLTKIGDDGAQLNYTQTEIEAIYDSFSDMADEINDGTDIDKLNTEYNKSQGLSGPDKLSVITIEKSDSTYPDGFFDKVSTIKAGKAEVVKTAGYVYVILRINISSKNYIDQYRNNLLEYLKSSDIDNYIQQWLANNTDIKLSGLSKLYKTVSQKHTDETTTQQ